MSGRVAVVTGSGRGIGREVARHLAAAGDTVILTARQQGKAVAATETLAGACGTVVAHQLDVTDPAASAALAHFVGEPFGRLEVLVNNAAIHYDTQQQAGAADLSIVREALETNLLGAWQATQAMLPLLRRSEHGRIVKVSSQGGWRPTSRRRATSVIWAVDLPDSGPTGGFYRDGRSLPW